MKRYLLSVLFAAFATITQAQLQEDFDPEPTGWILDKSAKFANLNSNAIVQTSGAGDNVPSVIGTPSVRKTSNTVQVCLDIWAYDPPMDNQIPFPCVPTYMDVLFVYSSVADFNDAKDPDNVIASMDNYVLAPNGGNNCFTFTFPSAVTVDDFKVVLSFHGDCGTGGFKYVIDNVSISGVQLACGGTNCPPEALNDIFTSPSAYENEFNGALYGPNINYPGGNTVYVGGTDNDQNDVFADMKWGLIPGSVTGGTVVVNSNGTFTATRTNTAVTQMTFTYRYMDNGADNDINTLGDNLYDDATVTINWPAAGTLPVSLVNFNGNRNGNYVTLQWTTNMESNNIGFEIQRSIGNGVYEKVGYVPSKATDGNSGMPLYYQFKEANLAKANSWYRIMQIDKDGKSTVTPARGVRGLEELSKLTVYPNPAKSNNVNVLFGSSAVRDIIITDLGGRVVKQWNNFHDDNMVVTGLKTGVYMLIVNNRSTSERLTHRIVVL